MNFGWIKGALISGKDICVKHAPAILMGLGTAGVITGIGSALGAGPKAVYLIEEAEEAKATAMRERGEHLTKGDKLIVPYRAPLTLAEKAKATWKIYLLPVGMTVIGLGCFWGAHWVDVRRQAVLAVSLSTAEASLQEYQKKVIDMMGRDQHNEVMDAIAEDKAEKTRVPEIATGQNLGVNDIWYNLYGQMFPSNYQKVKNVENEFNHKMLNEIFLSKAELIQMLDPSGEFMRPEREDWHLYFNIDKLLVLHVANPTGPIATITFEDKYGLEYIPKPNF